MGFWADKLAESKASPPRAPQIPQAQPEADVSMDDLIAQACASVVKPDPALGVLSTPTSVFGQRQSLTPGADIGTTSRRPGPAAEAPDDLLNLNPRVRAALVALGIKDGRFGPGSAQAKDARDHAAGVQALVKDRTWDIIEDTTPRKAAVTRIAGHSYGR